MRSAAYSRSIAAVSLAALFVLLASPARADVIAWIFCGIGLAVAIFRGEYLTLAADVGAAIVAWGMLRPSGRRQGQKRAPFARLRLWWLRRRYKVLDGGKSKNEKRWMN